MEITKEEMASYRASAREREALEQRALGVRYGLAWDVARRAARILREEFGATGVVVFGSLVDRGLFHSRSDVDIAVWGMDEKMLYRAVGRLLAMDPEFKVDVVLVDQVSDSFRKQIEEEGVTV